MKRNQLLSKLRGGETVFGTFVYIGEPAVVEILGYAGLDFVLIDTEHSSIGLETMENMIRAAEVSGTTAVVRVPDNNPKSLLRVLEAGAGGIIVPHVFTAQEAADVVAAMKYPPQGRRGMGRQRTAMFGLADFDEYLEWANTQIMVSIMVEDKEAVDRIEEIAAVPGLDMIFVGPGDMSASLGVPGGNRLDEPKRYVKRAVDAIRDQGGPAIGMPGYTEDEVPALVEAGVQFITSPSSDKGVLSAGFRDALARIKEQLRTEAV